MQQQNFRQCLGLIVFGVFTLSIFGNVGSAIAQQKKNTFGNSFRNRPKGSSYLSLVDQGNGSGQEALNYYNIIKPQQRARQASENLQNELRGVEAGLQGDRGDIATPSNSISITTGRLPPTGHPAVFGDNGNYFGGTAGGGAVSSGGQGRRKSKSR